MFSSFDLAVEVWKTGDPGYSIMSLTWKASDLSKPVPREWLVVASGQYATPTEAPVEFYCRYPGARMVGDTVHCRDVEDPLKGVEYRTRGEIGKVSDRAVVAIEDYRGYDKTAATLVSATVADGYQPDKYSKPFEVHIPFRSSAVADFGASSLVRYAGVNVGDDGEHGLGQVLRQLPLSSTLSEADFADPVDQRALWFPRLNSTDFEVLEQLDARQVQWSVPAAQDPGRLRWHVDEAGLAGVSFQLFDPEKADSTSRRTFFAGILVSLASAALLLLFDKWRSERKA